MHIHILMNNTALAGYDREHGLSMLIELDSKSILFDTGASDTYLSNATKMDVEPISADYVILSHAHYDHTSGLQGLFEANTQIKAWANPGWDGRYYSANSDHEIGIPLDTIKQYHDRFVSLEGNQEISPGIHLIGKIPLDVETVSKKMFAITQNGKKTDLFEHELLLLIEQEDGLVMITGCSHRSIGCHILAVQDAFAGKHIKALIGGFHLSDQPVAIKHAIEAFEKANIDKIYTGHCTGQDGYEALVDTLGNKVQWFHAGESIEI